MRRADGFAEFPLKERDLAALGFRLAASSGTAFAAMVKAVRQSYECLAQGRIDPFIGKGNVEKEMKAAMATAGLDRLLEIERRTMKEYLVAIDARWLTGLLATVGLLRVLLVNASMHLPEHQRRRRSRD